MSGRTLLTGSLLTLVLAGIGGTDYWFRERPNQVTAIDTAPDVITDASSSASTASAASQGMSSSRTVVKKGTRKAELETVEQILARTGFAMQETREASLLQMGTAVGATIKTGVLLFSNDRAALFSWTDSPDAKTLFLDLKQGLQKNFSPQMRDLVDRRVVPDDGTTYDLLSFTDPAISNDDIIFIRTRTRIYELHVTQGKDAAIQGLIAELVK